MEKNCVTAFMSYVKHYNKGILGCFLLGALVNSVPLFIFYCVKQMMDTFISDKDFANVIRYSVMLFGLVIFSFLINYIMVNFKGKISGGLAYAIRKDFFAMLQQVKYGFFSKSNTADISTNIIQDIETLINLSMDSLFDALIQLLFYLVTFFILLKINVILTLCQLCIFIVVYMFNIIAKNYMKRKYEEVALARGTLNSDLKDITEGIEIINQYNAKDYFLNKLEVSNKDYIMKVMRTNLFGPINGSIIILATMGTYILTFVIGSKWLKNGNLTYGDLFLFLTYMPQLWAKFNSIADLQRTIISVKVYAIRVFKIYQIKDKENINIAAITTEFKDEKFMSVCFNNVCFSYNANQKVLHNLSFFIDKPSITCIIGPSGIGKTTLFDLILRFFDVESGTIEINNINIKNMPIQFIREKIGVIHQTPFLINDTVMNNIKFGNFGIPDEQIYETAKKWGLHKYLYELNNGYETIVGHLGDVLSMGQKRIIGIVRILCRNPEVILLDEITSNIDSHSEIIIREILKKLSKTNMCMLITHKSEDLQLATNVVRLNNPNQQID